MSNKGWMRVPLRDIASDIKDGTHGTHKRVASGIPFLSAKNVVPTGRLLWSEDDDFISEYEYQAITSSFAPKQGDLLITVVGTLGRTALFDGSKVAFQRSVAFVRPNSRIISNYLLQASKDADFTRQMERRSNATAQAGLYLGELAKIQIPLPTIDQQCRIADILQTIDRTITHTEALIEKYHQIKAGLMHDLFTRGIGADGKLRPTRDQAPEMYQESSIGWIPKEWEVKPIGQVFSVQLGKMLSPLAKTGKFECSYLNNRSVHWDKVDIEGLSSMDFNPEEREKFKLIYGDLLVCEGGDVGRTAMWRDDLENCYFQKTIHRLRSLNNEVLPEFMLRFMMYAKNTGMFSNFTSQTSIAHLTREKLITVNVFVPDVTEQEQLVKRFESIDHNISVEINFMDKLKKQKSGLMHDLLTGTVQVNSEEIT
jgi:type I restriction enzyme, S subunit